MIAEQISNLYIESSTRKLVNRIDLSQLMQTGQSIQKWINKIQEECNFQCFIEAELKHENKRLNQINTELHNTLRQIYNTNRHKRHSPVTYFSVTFWNFNT